MKFCILGSCVTRDAFDLVPHTHSLTSFISRQSFACAFRDEAFPLTLDEIEAQQVLEDKYPRRMLALNLAGRLQDHLAEASRGADALIVDFIDERHFLVDKDGKLATYCTAFRGLRKFDEAELMSPLDQQRVALFAEGARRLKKAADDLGLPVLLHKATWAHGSKGNGGTDAKFVDANNAMLAQYFAIAEDLGFLPLDPGATAPKSDPDHRWGDAPFHYTTPTYVQLLAELDRWSKEQGRPE